MYAIKQDDFDQLVKYIKNNYGIDLSRKKDLIEARLGSTIAGKGFNSFEQYLSSVYADRTGTEVAALIDKLTTNYTFFMREWDHFEYYRDQVLPYIARTEKSQDLRVWSAGCASGEEPYTLAMINQDFFAPGMGKWDTRILATDISTSSLNTARAGIYTAENLAAVPASWRTRYFRKVDANRYALSEEIKQQVIFRTFNLRNDPFNFKKKFHVIFCRNVMIYFDKEAKLELVRKFYEHTETGGYLFIGHTESISREVAGYTYVRPAVYRKEH